MSNEKDTCGYLEEMYLPIEKLRGIAALFFIKMKDEHIDLDVVESNGVCSILKGIADELERLQDNAIEAWKRGGAG